VSALLPWQEGQLERLQTLYQAGSLSHAFLIHDLGHEVEASRSFAAQFAAGVLCENQLLGGCLRCSSCQLRQAGSHADLHWLRPEEAKQIKIEQIRSAIDWSHQTAQQGRAKVLVLDTVEHMNMYATNALLKLLEEPVENTFILLLSSRPLLVLPTLKSRCQRLEISACLPAEAIVWLAKRHPDIEEADLQSLYDLTGQQPLAADQLLQSGEQNQVLNLVEGLQHWLKGEVTPIQAGQRLHVKERPEMVFDVLFRAIAEAHRHQSGSQTKMKSESVRYLSELLKGRFDHRHLCQLSDRAVKARQAVLSGHNLNAALLIDQFLLNTEIT
jgi:DNA polymerase-3 subunit delta'